MTFNNNFNNQIFQGDKGRVLLQLSKTYKGDNRFKLNQKFKQDLDVQKLPQKFKQIAQKEVIDKALGKTKKIQKKMQPTLIIQRFQPGTQSAKKIIKKAQGTKHYIESIKKGLQKKKKKIQIKKGIDKVKKAQHILSKNDKQRNFKQPSFKLQVKGDLKEAFKPIKNQKNRIITQPKKYQFNKYKLIIKYISLKIKARSLIRYLQRFVLKNLLEQYMLKLIYHYLHHIINSIFFSISIQRTMKIQKQATFKFLKRLNKELSNKFAEMKQQFQRTPPPNHQIKKKFSEWKSKYDQIVFTTLKEVQDIDQKNFDFKQFIVKITEQFGTDQQFLQLLKNVNHSIQNLKDFIRMNLIKDPSIYQIKQ